MIKVSDYIIQRLVDYGVKDVFMISGGGAMHLNDSVGKNENIRYICNHHEQASAIAAEGYARASGKLAVVIVTSGPGGTNTITGVIGQWLDSIPVLYISGQVKQETTIASCPDIPLRQLGDQEINIIDIVRPVTKFAATITNPLDTRNLLDQAIHMAITGRPGPVWLDVPLDIQGSLVNEEEMVTYIPTTETIVFDHLKSKIRETLALLQKSRRPVILAGHGIRISGANDLFYELIPKLGIPVLSTFNGFDLIDTDNPLYMGRIGTIGNRSGNFVLQNCDLLLSLGSRNNIRQTGFNWNSFAGKATKIIVDIDRAELEKPTIKPDLAVNMDVRQFLEQLAVTSEGILFPDWTDWMTWCTERKLKYPAVSPDMCKQTDCVNPYVFMKTLTESLDQDALVVAGNGTACVSLFQAGVVKKGQRYIWNSGCASMGYDLPAAIGACFARGKSDVICLAGDGSLQMNIQELQTLAHHRLPIKIFVLNNGGYASIRQTQDSFFGGNHVACDIHSGVSFPDISKIAAAYGIPSVIIDRNQTMQAKIEEILTTQGPVICDVQLDQLFNFSPKSSSERKPDGRMISKPLEDMYPFLDREEFMSNMLE
jgi:acetolactate synthase-1/2/3 large subunit